MKILKPIRKFLKDWLYGTRQVKFFEDGEYVVYSKDSSLYQARDITISNGFIVKNLPSTTQNVIADMLSQNPRGFISEAEPKKKVVFNLELKQEPEENDIKVGDIIGQFELHKIYPAIDKKESNVELKEIDETIGSIHYSYEKIITNSNGELIKRVKIPDVKKEKPAE